MTNPAKLDTWTIYQSAWSDVDDQERRVLLAKSVHEDCLYSDPNDLCRGVDELVTHIEESQAKMPGASFRNDRLLEHHDRALSEWTMFDGAGSIFTTGASFARFGGDGRLVEMTGFFEPKR